MLQPEWVNPHRYQVPTYIESREIWSPRGRGFSSGLGRIGVLGPSELLTRVRSASKQKFATRGRTINYLREKCSLDRTWKLFSIIRLRNSTLSDYISKRSALSQSTRCLAEQAVWRVLSGRSRCQTCCSVSMGVAATPSITCFFNSLAKYLIEFFFFFSACNR